MAVKGTEARIIVDQWDLSCETSSLVMSNAISEEDCTTLCSTAAEYAPVLPSMSITQDGYIEVAGEEGYLEEELYSRMGVMGAYVCALFRTGVPNCIGYILDSTFGSSMEISAPMAGLLTLNGAWGQGRGGHRGLRIYGGEALAVGTQTAQAHDDDGTQGGEAYLFVTGATGSLGTATIALQHSATEGGTYSNLGVFSVPDLGAYKISYAGAVNMWHRINITSMGGATALTMTCVSCIRGVSE